MAKRVGKRGDPNGLDAGKMVRFENDKLTGIEFVNVDLGRCSLDDVNLAGGSAKNVTLRTST